ncbi:hypothetical protein V1288_003748 [Bradyrhizobium sp. AZCC 2176]
MPWLKDPETAPVFWMIAAGCLLLLALAFLIR